MGSVWVTRQQTLWWLPAVCGQTEGSRQILALCWCVGTLQNAVLRGKITHASDPFGKVGRDFCLDLSELNCTLTICEINQLLPEVDPHTVSRHKQLFLFLLESRGICMWMVLQCVFIRSHINLLITSVCFFPPAGLHSRSYYLRLH